MDKFLKPDKFDGDPNSPTALQEWNFWLKTFENFIASFDEEDIDDENKAKRLLTAKTFPLTSEAIADFNQLKTEISKAVVSTIDDFEPFVVETDASDFSISAVLSQCGRPVAFFSQKLDDSERKHSSFEKEAFAIVCS
ncbi:uncharacterized protein LOC120352936 [Nilaparvata lugens]|uniref:uncharacterized protein LOC120352936 n=1 Tax=Nilaparvata lugens TaxID=108931 RepID=UPI00193E11ED|nr:uncharacterized protein LOC120352936 [Nilaparvata lugens]